MYSIHDNHFKTNIERNNLFSTANRANRTYCIQTLGVRHAYINTFITQGDLHFGAVNNKV
jgi:hypothetical protein